MAISLTQLLAAAVRRHPRRPAVGLSGGPPLTYGELGAAAAAVAAALARHGISRGDRVGLLCPKSPEAIAGLWGILLAGAAYVPIDPGAPPLRAAYIAGDCRPAALLASTEQEAAVAAIRRELPGAPVLQIHGDGALAAAELRLALGGGGEPAAATAAAGAGGAARPAAGALELAGNARDLAYVLYTSGSTGRPKGVMISHGAALAFVEWAAWRFALRTTDVLSGHAPLHFDLSIFDVFAAAAAAARLVLLDDETVRFPLASAAAIAAERITVWYSVPGALRRMREAGGLRQPDCASLRCVLFAGEVFPAEELRRLQRALPRVRLFNLYGPTETNVCTCWSVPPAGTWRHAAIPIGHDCETCQGVIVDEQLRPVAPGVVGELLVRGGSLMEGYWGDDARTAAALVRDFQYPHLRDAFYRTGDLVSRQPDGTYAFHGRRDHMIKLRGHRVELGEVEAALHAAAGVGEAAVVAIERRRGGGAGAEAELVAFVVSDDGPPGSPGLAARALRQELAARLPRYMLPAELRWVASLPRTATGKVDRQALASAAVAEEE
jgi:amino acid adenylation domain-containing protein